MKTKFFASLSVLAFVSFVISSCTKDLNREPFYGLNANSVYSQDSNYIHVLAKLYASLSITGNQGPAGKPDINGFDEGASGYTRVLFNLQELPTDEAVCAWSDPGIPDLHNMAWNSNNQWVIYMYYRIYIMITICNEFIRETTDDALASRGFTADQVAELKTEHAEARFLRALAYYHALDLFGNVPFVTEQDQPGAFFPKQISRDSLFAYVERELLDCQNNMTPPGQNAYGRASQAAAWALLARLYINAQVYTASPSIPGQEATTPGPARYTDCITYCNKIINSSFSLDPNYTHLFLADNSTSPEIIFPVEGDGKNTQTYGCTTFLVHAPVGGKMNPKDFGINSGWAGYRATSAFVSYFQIPGDTTLDSLDHRELFFTTGQSLQINNIATFTDGYAIAKWKNVTSTGQAGSDPSGNFVDTDFPMFRLADVYLMYAEAVLRDGSGGDMGTALHYVNLLRERAYGDASHDVGSIDLNFVLAERSRELYWESIRRTDLIRYGLFTGGDYIWPWKGGVKDGQATDAHFNIYPIPNSDIVANPSLKQNWDY